jgi:hypothetical protein
MKKAWDTLDIGPIQELEQRGKLEEIDLLASIKNRGESGCREQQQQQSSVPDVVAMELEAFHGQELYREPEKLLGGDNEEHVHVDSKKKEKMLRNQARRRQQSTAGHRIKHDTKNRSDLENGQL